LVIKFVLKINYELQNK